MRVPLHRGFDGLSGRSPRSQQANGSPTTLAIAGVYEAGGSTPPPPVQPSGRPAPVCPHPAAAAPLAHDVPQARGGQMVPPDRRLIGLTAAQEGNPGPL